MREVTRFECGMPSDHKCDDDGPIMCGGERDGEFWQAIETPETRKGASWGSVSCSQCGRTSMQLAAWSDWG